MGYFPPNVILRPRYLFAAGVIEWWQKYAEYSLILKTSIHSDRLLPKTDNQTSTGVQGGSKTAVVILTLIPGVGWLISFIVFSCGETSIRKPLQKIFYSVLTYCLSTIIKQFKDFRRFGFKSHAQVESVISINVQPKL